MNDPEYLENIQFSVMFCNDVRIERDGQVTYVGVYQPHLTVKEFPFKFRTFTAVLTLLAPGNIQTEGATFRVLRNDKVIMNYTAEPTEGLTKHHELRMSVNMETEGLELHEPSLFRAEVLIGGKLYRSRNVLNVTTKPFNGLSGAGREQRTLLGG